MIRAYSYVLGALAAAAVAIGLLGGLAQRVGASADTRDATIARQAQTIRDQHAALKRRGEDLRRLERQVDKVAAGVKRCELYAARLGLK